MKNFIFKIDRFIGELFHNIYLWGGDLCTNIMKGISFLAEAGILFILIGIGLALFKRTRKIGTTILFAIAIGFLFTNVIFKNIIERARPFGNVSSEFYKWWLDAGANYESGYSFPSGHTTATTAFAVAIFLTTPKKHSWYILSLPILMASSRIYLMVHYFSDCVGGLVVGLVVALLALLIVKWIYSSNIKLFVWARELDIFKSKNSKSSIKVSQTKQDSQQKVVEKEQIYITQDEEYSTKADNDSLIKQKVKDTEISNENQTDDIDNR